MLALSMRFGRTEELTAMVWKPFVYNFVMSAAPMPGFKLSHASPLALPRHTMCLDRVDDKNGALLSDVLNTLARMLGGDTLSDRYCRHCVIVKAQLDKD